MTDCHKFGTSSPITCHAWNKDRSRKFINTAKNKLKNNYLTFFQQKLHFLQTIMKWKCINIVEATGNLWTPLINTISV